MDLSSHPVVDSHCHAFLPEKETKSFEQYLTLADHPVPKRDIANTFLYRRVVRELSRVLEVEGTHDEVVDERNVRYRQDPAGYIKMLFEDAGIETLLVDTGYPSKEFSGYSVDLGGFSEIVPCEVREIYRIDNTVYNLLCERLPFDAMLGEFNRRIHDAGRGGAVSLKSVIAYRTGLEIRRRTEEESKKAYRDFIDSVESGRRVLDIIRSKPDFVKALWDNFVFLGVEKSVELGLPFQIHVGIGDVPGIDLRTSNPLLLRDLINDDCARDARIVLTHGGYPYVEEAGFLINTYPNLYLDISETVPFISIGAKEKLLNLFEMGPTTKIMHGSDGYNIPELFWISAIRAKRALSAALKELVEANEIDEGWAEEIAEQILSGNAKRIYKLTSG